MVTDRPNYCDVPAVIESDAWDIIVDQLPKPLDATVVIADLPRVIRGWSYRAIAERWGWDRRKATALVRAHREQVNLSRLPSLPAHPDDDPRFWSDEEQLEALDHHFRESEEMAGFEVVHEPRKDEEEPESRWCSLSRAHVSLRARAPARQVEDLGSEILSERGAAMSPGAGSSPTPTAVAEPRPTAVSDEGTTAGPDGASNDETNDDGAASVEEAAVDGDDIEGVKTQAPPPLSDRAKAALQAAGVTKWTALAALTRQAVEAWPGVGKATAAELARHLEHRGLSFAEAPKRKAPPLDPSVRDVLDDWLAEWRSVGAWGDTYPWQCDGKRPHDRSRADGWIRLAKQLGRDRWREVLRSAIRRYLLAAKRGEAWPKGEPPSVRLFDTQARRWVLEAANAPAGEAPEDTPRRRPNEGLMEFLRRAARERAERGIVHETLPLLGGRHGNAR